MYNFSSNKSKQKNIKANTIHIIKFNSDMYLTIETQIVLWYQKMNKKHAIHILFSTSICFIHTTPISEIRANKTQTKTDSSILFCISCIVNHFASKNFSCISQQKQQYKRQNYMLHVTMKLV